RMRSDSSSPAIQNLYCPVTGACRKPRTRWPRLSAQLVGVSKLGSRSFPVGFAGYAALEVRVAMVAPVMLSHHSRKICPLPRFGSSTVQLNDVLTAPPVEAVTVTVVGYTP